MMKEVVYIAGCLASVKADGVAYGEKVINGLKNIKEIEVVSIQNHSNNVWCRDYMPVKSATGKYVQFSYYPSYMKEIKKYDGMYPDTSMIHEKLNLECITPKQKIFLDGGAIEIHGDKGIVSDRVFRDNHTMSASVVYDELKEVLELNQLIVVPQYPHDFTGHVDGMVRFIDKNKVVVNDLDKELKEANSLSNKTSRRLIENWVFAFQSALLSAGLELAQLPTSSPANGSYNSGEGIYINFLRLKELIIMPAYNNKTDDEAAEKLAKLYDLEVVKIDASELSTQGGMINCVTWTK